MAEKRRSWFKGCLLAPLTLVLLCVATCQGVRYSEESRIRERLPVELQGGSFVFYDACDRIFGGYSYAITIAPDVAERIVSQGPDFLEYTHVARPYRKALWEPTQLYEGLAEGKDPGMAGLFCFRQYKFEGEHLIDHIYRDGSYVTIDGRESLIILPSLGVAIGGFDPR